MTFDEAVPQVVNGLKLVRLEQAGKVSRDV